MVEEPLWLTNARRPTRTWAARLSTATMMIIMIWPLLWWAISEVLKWYGWWQIKTLNVLDSCYLVCACVQSIDRVCLWLRIRLLRRNTDITSCWNAAKSHQQHQQHCFCLAASKSHQFSLFPHLYIVGVSSLNWALDLRMPTLRNGGIWTIVGIRRGKKPRLIIRVNHFPVWQWDDTVEYELGVLLQEKRGWRRYLKVFAAYHFSVWAPSPPLLSRPLVPW